MDLFNCVLRWFISYGIFPSEFSVADSPSEMGLLELIFIKKDIEVVCKCRLVLTGAVSEEGEQGTLSSLRSGNGELRAGNPAMPRILSLSHPSSCLPVFFGGGLFWFCKEIN